MSEFFKILPRRMPEASLPAHATSGELIITTDTGTMWVGRGPSAPLQEIGGGALPSGTGNQIIATPDGASGIAILRSLVVNDIPSLSALYDVSGAAASAETASKSYADGLASGYDVVGAASTALTSAESYTDSETSRAETAEALLQPLSAKGVANGYASLDSGGHIPSSQLPAVVISNTYVVSTQAAMLALSADVGDIAVRTDVSESFILQSEPASTLGNWVQLLSPPNAVLSVFGRTGAVTAQSGDYSAAEITGLVASATTDTTNASNITSGTLSHAQLPALVSGDIPNNAANTSGTSSNVSGTPALPNGTTATTQTALDASTKLATTSYVDSATSALAGPMVSPGGIVLPFPDSISSATTFSVSGMGANQGYLFQFRLRSATKITQARAYQAAGTTAGAKIYFGIYSITGVLLVTISFTLASAAGVLSGTVSATTVLPEGDYYYLVAIDTASVADTLVSYTLAANVATMMNSTATRCGYKTNILSSGALATPITLSTFTANAGFGGTSSIPLIFVNA